MQSFYEKSLSNNFFYRITFHPSEYHIGYSLTWYAHLLVWSTVHHSILGIHLQLQRQLYIQTQLPQWFLNRHLHTLTQFPLYQYHTLLKVDTMLLNIYQNLEFFNKTLDKGKGYVNKVTYDEARVELYFSVVNLHNVNLNLLLGTIN